MHGGKQSWEKVVLAQAHVGSLQKERLGKEVVGISGVEVFGKDDKSSRKRIPRIVSKRRF